MLIIFIVAFIFRQVANAAIRWLYSTDVIVANPSYDDGHLQMMMRSQETDWPPSPKTRFQNRAFIHDFALLGGNLDNVDMYPNL